MNVRQEARPDPVGASPELCRLGGLHLDALRTHQVQPLALHCMTFHSSDHADALNHATWMRLAQEVTHVALHETNHESILREPAVQAISEHFQNWLLENHLFEDELLDCEEKHPRDCR